MTLPANSAAAQAAALVLSALDEIDNPSVPLSAIIRKAIRIARLRNDYQALFWLLTEMRPPGDDEARRRDMLELAPHFTNDVFKRLWRNTTEAYVTGRQIDDDRILGVAVAEAEANLDGLRRQVAAMQLPIGLAPVDLYFENQRHENTKAELLHAIAEREQILARVRGRVANFLSDTERELLFGQVNSNLFERNREHVDARLKVLAPDALDQFAAAYRREAEGDVESRSHALTSCRRVLKSVADALYPATGEDAEGVDGTTRKMTDDHWISRLCQFAGERAKGSASAELLRQQVADLASRLDVLNGLTSKGVHDKVTDAEVAQCLMQTYITVGDLLRLAADDSGSAAVGSLP